MGKRSKKDRNYKKKPRRNILDEESGEEEDCSLAMQEAVEKRTTTTKRSRQAEPLASCHHRGRGDPRRQSRAPRRPRCRSLRIFPKNPSNVNDFHENHRLLSNFHDFDGAAKRTEPAAGVVGGAIHGGRAARSSGGACVSAARSFRG